MQYRTVIGIAILAATSASSSLQAAGSAEMNGKLKVVPLEQEEILFTGKPYNKQLGMYVFKFRNYAPSVARWASADPMGFPDGPNNRIYAPVPTIGYDPLGLDGGVVTNSTSETIYVYGQDVNGNATVIALPPGHSSAEPEYFGDGPGKSHSDADMILPGDTSLDGHSEGWGYKVSDGTGVDVWTDPDGGLHTNDQNNFMNGWVSPGDGGSPGGLLAAALALAKELFPDIFE